MRKSLLGLAITGIGGLVLAWVNHKAKKEYKAYAEETANELQVIPELNEAKDHMALCDKVLANERTELDKRMRTWDREFGYGEQIRQINQDAVNAIKELSGSERPENVEVKLVTEKKNAAMTAFKKAIAYEQAKSNRDKAVANAKAKYAKASAVADCADSDISETATALKHAAEKAMNEAIEKANKAFEEVQAKVDALESEWDEKVLTAKTAQEEMYYNEKKDILDRKQKLIDALKEKRTAARQDISTQLVAERSYDQHDAVVNYDRYRDKVHEIEAIRDETTAHMMQESTLADRIRYFVEKHNVSKYAFLGVAAIPLVGLGILGWSYVTYILNLMKGVYV